jgi:hypothetical protein
MTHSGKWRRQYPHSSPGFRDVAGSPKSNQPGGEAGLILLVMGFRS